MSKPVKITPMLRQYLEIKEQYKDAILFYRMGDFYEMFFDDAVTASRVLGITLTSRSSKDDANRVPMCGVPYHAVAGYLGKMIKAGYRVAICEQIEDPKQAKGIVRREVVRVVTPGVTTDEQILDEKSNCFVCSLAIQVSGRGRRTAGLGFLDVSTGNFRLSEVELTAEDDDRLIDEITRMEPAELLLAESAAEPLAPLTGTLATLLGGLCVTPRPDDTFEEDTARQVLTEHFRTTTLAGFGCDTMTAAIRAAGALLAYIQETQKTDLGHIRKLTPLSSRDCLVIDETSRRNLELTETIIGGKRDGSLLSVLDLTCTPMGARLLRQWLLFPLQDRERIRARLGSVQDLLADPGLRRELREQLAAIYDLERLCSRLALGHGNARDMTSLKLSLARLPEIRTMLLAMEPGLLRSLAEDLDELEDLHELIDRAIREDAPVTLREGNLIREGYNGELDELLHLLRDGRQLILELEQRERERTGMAKLKVGYNKVFGYYLEVSRAQAGEIPEDYIRKQTLVNAERFITPELKELENRISSASERRLELEYRLFSEIRNHIAARSRRLLDSAGRIARIDVLACLAEAAARYHYTRPEISEDDGITITEGRHPVIERSLEAGRFVPNDIHLDQRQQELLIITGPNMAGKSTVLRQTALIVLMAHIGSFVPAEAAEICIVDRIFTRVGAMDDLRRGQSTFMVEMNETANILNNATHRSLVILDEIGRGTSTYDGMAIARAVAEELADRDGRGIKTLFATHYHELTDLATRHPRICNYSIAVREWNDSIIFLHKLVAGATNRSYGIQVAGLAGVPPHVVARAHEILQEIEQGGLRSRDRFPAAGRDRKPARERHRQPCQLPLFQPPAEPLRRLLQEVDPDNTTPRQALELLYQARALLDDAD
ncbi:DNA mismatch repair protein MutS [Thermodesulfobacteriota bacterium B35]